MLVTEDRSCSGGQVTPIGILVDWKSRRRKHMHFLCAYFKVDAANAWYC